MTTPTPTALPTAADVHLVPCLSPRCGATYAYLRIPDPIVYRAWYAHHHDHTPEGPCPTSSP